MQADPNATGMVLIDCVVMNGQCPSPITNEFNIDSHFEDGVNLYQYLGSSSLTKADPLGLYDLDDFKEDLMGIDFGLVPGPSDFITGGLQAVVEEYSANLMWDSDWAGDWGSGDDWHSRTDNRWVELAIIRGLYEAFDIEIPFTDYKINPLDLTVFGRATPSGTRRKGPKIRRLGMTFTQRIEWEAPDGRVFRATRFQHPRYNMPFVRFDNDSVFDTHTLSSRGATTSQDIRAANKARGKPQDYNWKNEFGFECTWNHDRRNPLKLQLVPRWLHEATLPHIGGRKTGAPG